MMHYSRSQMALLTAICVLGIACTEGPTDSAAELTGPEFAKGGNKGPPPSGDRPITVEFGDDTGDKIRSDGRGTYADGCNVSARFNLNDAILNLKGRIKKKDEATCGDPRFIAVSFTDLLTSSPPGSQDGNTVQGRFMNIDHVETVTATNEVRAGGFQMPGCAHGIRFNTAVHSTAQFTVNNVLVTRVGNDTWMVESEAPHVAVCIPDEDKPQAGPRSYYHLPFKITVALKQ